MSYILEALRRAERERQTGQSTGSQSGAAPPPAPRLRPTTMALAGATLFLAGVGVAALLLRSPTTEPPAATTPPPATTAQITPAPLPVYTPEAVPDAPTLPADDAVSLDDIAPVFQGTPTLVTPAPAPVPTPAAAVQTSATPAATAVTATPGPERPPTLREVPAELRARFPEIALQVHVHNADPARRWIMVDNRRVGEGATLDSGVRVIEILPDGVIFELDGRPLFWPLTR
jgi:general secretion pathway protein B